MSAHTPGTWYYAEALRAVVVCGEHKLKIVADFGKCDLPETEANARLIAAAPDLLALLIEARERMLGSMPAIKSLRERTDAAIANAKPST